MSKTSHRITVAAGAILAGAVIPIAAAATAAAQPLDIDGHKSPFTTDFTETLQSTQTEIDIYNNDAATTTDIAASYYSIPIDIHNNLGTTNTSLVSPENAMVTIDDNKGPTNTDILVPGSGAANVTIDGNSGPTTTDIANTEEAVLGSMYPTNVSVDNNTGLTTINLDTDASNLYAPTDVVVVGGRGPVDVNIPVADPDTTTVTVDDGVRGLVTADVGGDIITVPDGDTLTVMGGVIESLVPTM